MQNGLIKQSLDLDQASAGSFKVDPRHGSIVDIGVANGKLLVVQQFALSVLDAPYDDAGFNLRLLTVSFKEIIPGTARALGDKILFFTFGGMCSFDGRNVELLDINYEYKSGTEYFSFILENRYFMSDLGRIKTLVVERFFDSHFFLDVGSLEEGVKTKRVWESDNFALGYAATRQFVQQIRVRTSGQVIVTVITEARQQQIVLNGREGIQTININLKGGVFRLRLESEDENIRISDLSVVIGFASSSIGTIRIG